MDKLERDRRGEIFQDELTENQSKPRGTSREDSEQQAKYDPGVDSQEADETMAQDRFGRNEQKRDDG